MATALLDLTPQITTVPWCMWCWVFSLSFSDMMAAHHCPHYDCAFSYFSIAKLHQVFDAKSLISSEFWDELASPKRAWFFLRLITERDRRMGFLSVAAWSASGSPLTLCSGTGLKQTLFTVNRQTSPKGSSSSAGNIMMTYMDIRTWRHTERTTWVDLVVKDPCSPHQWRALQDKAGL